MEWNTIFINISSDCILIDTWEKFRVVIPRNFVEKYLWKELVKLYREKWFQNVVVLNWPGWFTNLRVGTLCLNILNTLLDNQLSFYDISKIDLFKHAYERWILPRYWIIYIWQKRNLRLRDLEKNEKIWQYSFDELKNVEELNSVDNVFIDNVDDRNYYPEWMNKYVKYHTLLDWDRILFIEEKNYNKSPILIDELNLQAIKSIAPNYMMEPSVTLNHPKS